MLTEQARQELAIQPLEKIRQECSGIRPLAERLRRIEVANEVLTPLSVRISSDMRQRLENLIGHLPKRKRAQVLRALLEHAISAAEVQGCGGAVPD